MTANVQRLETSNGNLTFRLDETGLRTLKFNGAEVLRGLSAPIRDANWGTLPLRVTNWAVTRDGTELRCDMTFTAKNNLAWGHLVFCARPTAEGAQLTADFTLNVLGNLDSNRAGFCLLHPLNGVRGTPLSIAHPNGQTTEARFPTAISPGQPAQDIAALDHTVHGNHVHIAMEGEVFEMEDQRNWTDASYKTYCRPLSRPVPIRLRHGDTVAQTIVVTLTGGGTAPKEASHDTAAVSLPTLWLAAQPGWLSTSLPRSDGVLARFGPDLRWTDADLARLAEAPALAIEIAADNEADIDRVADRLSAAGLRVSYVTALPTPYLRSYQPDGDWPTIAAAALVKHTRLTFPDARIGIGVLTNFTELNRCPPPPGTGDFITYSTAAIVHAADDASVIETLEALPDIFESAGRLAKARPQRLGLLAIGMRTNPYGERLALPQSYPVPMTDADPRHTGGFGAAFGAAAAMLASTSGVDALCLGAPTGPFALTDVDGLTPLGCAMQQLRGLGPVRVSRPEALSWRATGKTHRLTATFSGIRTGTTFEEI